MRFSRPRQARVRPLSASAPAHARSLARSLQSSPRIRTPGALAILPAKNWSNALRLSRHFPTSDGNPFSFAAFGDERARGAVLRLTSLGFWIPLRFWPFDQERQSSIAQRTGRTLSERKARDDAGVATSDASLQCSARPTESFDLPTPPSTFPASGLTSLWPSIPAAKPNTISTFLPSSKPPPNTPQLPRVQPKLSVPQTHQSSRQCRPTSWRPAALPTPSAPAASRPSYSQTCRAPPTDSPSPATSTLPISSSPQQKGAARTKYSSRTSNFLRPVFIPSSSSRVTACTFSSRRS